jgi:kinesin family member 6/9
MIKEGKAINLSLHFLEQVILSLREQMKKQETESFRKKIKRSNSTPLASARSSLTPSSGSASTRHHIPYRNSLLTTVLRDSLGGNCKSCFLLTISLDSEYFEESISTMRSSPLPFLVPHCHCQVWSTMWRNPSEGSSQS